MAKKVEGYKDKLGNTWAIESGDGNYKARITAPAFGLPGNRLLVVMSSRDGAVEQIEEIADEWTETGKVTERGGDIIVQTSAPKSGGLGLLLGVVLVLLAMSDKRR